MSRCLRLACFALLLSALLLPSGCGSGLSPLAKVKGTVTLDGKPLASGTMTFESVGQRPATGKIVQGQIVEMTTYDENDGAPLGTHKVAVWALEEAAWQGEFDPLEGVILHEPRPDMMEAAE